MQKNHGGIGLLMEKRKMNNLCYAVGVKIFYLGSIPSNY